MSNKFKDKAKKPRILLFQYKHFDINKIKIYKKSYKNVVIYYIGYVTIKNFK